MTVHPRPTPAQRREHRAAQVRHIAVSTIALVGAGLTIALADIPWASPSAFLIALMLGLVVAEPDLPGGRNRAWLTPPRTGLLDLVQVIAATRRNDGNTGGNVHDTDDDLTAVADSEPEPSNVVPQPEPAAPLAVVEVINAVEPIPVDDMAIARKVGVIGRHCREGREAATVFLHAVTPASELVSTNSDNGNGGNGGN
jgi:hypothetical protein